MNGEIVGAAAIVLVAIGSRYLMSNTGRRRLQPVRTGDQQGDAYVAVLIAVTWRQRKRSFDTRELDFEPRRQLTFDPYRPPKWKKVQDGLQAFGLDSVRTAAETASSAHQAAMGTFAEWTRYRTDGHRTAALQARQAADEADQALLDDIRLELQAKGIPLADWQPGRAGDGISR
jgi:hypothetical protein